MDVGIIENMIGEHPFGISDAAIEEIMEAVKQLALEQFTLGMLAGLHQGEADRLRAPRRA